MVVVMFVVVVHEVVVTFIAGQINSIPRPSFAVAVVADVAVVVPGPASPAGTRTCSGLPASPPGTVAAGVAG